MHIGGKLWIWLCFCTIKFYFLSISLKSVGFRWGIWIFYLTWRYSLVSISKIVHQSLELSRCGFLYWLHLIKTFRHTFPDAPFKNSCSHFPSTQYKIKSSNYTKNKTCKKVVTCFYEVCLSIYLWRRCAYQREKAAAMKVHKNNLTGNAQDEFCNFPSFSQPKL